MIKLLFAVGGRRRQVRRLLHTVVIYVEYYLPLQVRRPLPATLAAIAATILLLQLLLLLPCRQGRNQVLLRLGRRWRRLLRELAAVEHVCIICIFFIVVRTHRILCLLFGLGLAQDRVGPLDAALHRALVHSVGHRGTRPLLRCRVGGRARPRHLNCGGAELDSLL